MKTTKIGLIGCGNISDAYFQTNQKFGFFEIVACADLDLDRAAAKAKQWNVPTACTVDELLQNSEVECVINLTIPRAHAEVACRCLEAGKSTYSEKPFAVTREEARAMTELAERKGLRLGSAPDTFLGGGHQTARKLIDDGAIGRPIGGSAFMVCHGHESWHPSPQFYYETGGGPMFDMGPYYITDLVQLLGPVKSVTGYARKAFEQRTITSQPLAGTVMEVEIPTHLVGALEFVNGAVISLVMSFDVWANRLPQLEIYGTEGSLFLPDPNGFGGPVKLHRAGAEPQEMPLTHGFTDNNRGIGLADMVQAMRSGRDHRCNERLAYHVLDVMVAFHESSATGRHVELTSTCERPAMLPHGQDEGCFDE
jgi:predicted dehydrogenase